MSSSIENTIPKCINLDIIILLDESGSMEEMGNEPIQALNEFCSNQKCNTSSKSTISITLFNNKINNIIDNIPLVSFKGIQSYKPFGMTALNDAICLTIKNKLDYNKTNTNVNTNNVIILIITDGLENASTKYNTIYRNKLIKMVKDKYKWEIIYLGANHDVVAECKEMNIKPNNCGIFQCNTPGTLLSLFRSASNSITNFYSNKDEEIDINVNTNI